MPRKSDRTKKTKASPEKVEKLKRTRTSRRRKASSSSEGQSDDSSALVKNLPQGEDEITPQTESGDAKVWQVKSDDSSSGTGEIKKLKICLSTKLPVTPEPDVATPRSRKKLNRTVSEPLSEGSEEKRRSRHKSRRATRESHDGASQETQSADEDKNSTNKITLQQQESNIQPEEGDGAEEAQNKSDFPHESEPIEILEAVIPEQEYLEPQSSFENSLVEQDSDKPIIKSDQSAPAVVSSAPQVENVEKKRKATPIAKRRRSRRLSGSSPEHDPTPEPEPVKLPLICEEPEQNQLENSSLNNIVQQQNQIEKEVNHAENTSHEALSNWNISQTDNNSENTETKVSENKETKASGNMETKASENLCEESEDRSPEVTSEIHEDIEPEPLKPDSISLPVQSVTNEEDPPKSDRNKAIFETHDPEPSESTFDNKYSDGNNSIKTDLIDENNHSKGNTDIKVSKSEPVETYNATPIVVSRKRRWGSRVSKSSLLTPVCISTDVLKDIIPEVKPVELEEAIEEKQHRKKSDSIDKLKVERPILPKIVIDNSENANAHRREQEKENRHKVEREDRHEHEREDRHKWNKDRHDLEKGGRDSLMSEHRKISIIKDNSTSARPPSPPRHKSSNILYITHLVRPFTLPQLKNLLQRTGKILDFWIDRIKSKCFVIYESEDQAIETRHALHGVTWPVSNPKTLQVDFTSQEHLDKVRALEEDKKEVSTIPGTVEDWLKEQDLKKERQAEMVDSKSWDKRTVTREWDVGKGDKDKDRERQRGEREDERITDKRRRKSSEKSPVRKFPKKEEEAPAKLLDDLFRKTKSVPCIYWLPLSEETIAIKEEQRRLHMAENERRLAELERSRAHRRR